MIDSLYKEVDKNHFYLGMISQVYKNNSVIQIENLSWLNFRRINHELLIPNTINFYVVIDSVNGLFIGEIYQSKIPSTNSVHKALINEESERIYPEKSVDINGVLLPGETEFIQPGFLNVGLTDKVYIANNDIVEKFLNSIEVKNDSNIKKEEKIEPFAHFFNMRSKTFSLRPSTLFSRHIMSIGTTNSGKSTTSLSILDKLIKSRKKVLIIDPTGEYKRTFSSDEKFVKLTLGDDTAINTGELKQYQWAMLFETNEASQPAILYKAIKSLRYQFKNGNDGPYSKVNKKVDEVERELSSLTNSDKEFELKWLPKQVAEESVKVDKGKYIYNDFNFNSYQWLVEKINYKIENTELVQFCNQDFKNNLFEKLDNFINTKEQSLYIDASLMGIGDGVGSMIIDIVSQYIINHKIKNDISFVMFIDEVHRYIQEDYSTYLTNIAKEGRKKGIFLFLTTQNPHDVPTALLGQVGSLLIHRLTHRKEIETIRNFLSDDSVRQLPKLNQGEVIFTSINLLKDVQLKIIKSEKNHDNDTIEL